MRSEGLPFNYNHALHQKAQCSADFLKAIYFRLADRTHPDAIKFPIYEDMTVPIDYELSNLNCINVDGNNNKLPNNIQTEPLLCAL